MTNSGFEIATWVWVFVLSATAWIGSAVLGKWTVYNALYLGSGPALIWLGGMLWRWWHATGDRLLFGLALVLGGAGTVQSFWVADRLLTEMRHGDINAPRVLSGGWAFGVLQAAVVVLMVGTWIVCAEIRAVDHQTGRRSLWRSYAPVMLMVGLALLALWRG